MPPQTTEAAPTVESLLRALSSETHLTVQYTIEVGDLSLDPDEFETLWPQARAALERGASPPTIETVLVLDDGHHESLPFLKRLPRLAQLVLYGNTLIDDLSALQGHPSFTRLALTNYCGVHTGAQLSWLETAPRVEEIILFNDYLEIDDWRPSPALLGRLRSLWLPWETFRDLPVTGELSALERLTLEFRDVGELAEELNEADRSRFAGLRAGATLRAVARNATELAALTRLIAGRLPEGVSLEGHDHAMNLLHGPEAFLAGPIRPPRRAG